MEKPQGTGIFEMLGRIHETAGKTDGKVDVLATKFDSLKEANELAHNQINTHLKILNGQTARNTKFRWQIYAYVPIVVIIISAIVTLIFNKIF